MIGFCVGGSEEQHIVFAAALFPIYFGDERRQFLEVGRVTVHQRMATVIPPADARLPVLLDLTLAAHEEPQFVFELSTGDAVALEDVEQVGRSQRERLVKQVAARAFPAGLCLAVDEDSVQ